MKRITEGAAIIEVPEESKVSRKLEVFYNPLMKLNRDMTVLLLNAVDKTNMNIAEPLAGTGVRSIRLAKELKKGKIKQLFVNDRNSFEKLKKNFKANKIKATLSKLDANEFMLSNNGFDYIDLDPFGSPNDFLDAAIIRLARNGILGVTATDTAALCGAYPKTLLRNYWAKNDRNGFMHESALRILARKVQLIGAQHDKALIPILSYAKEHYVRIFFMCIKSKEKADEIMKQHKYVLYDQKTLAYEVSDVNKKKDLVTIGPLYVGSLCNKELLATMLNTSHAGMFRRVLGKSPEVVYPEANKLLQELYNELDIVGCYDLHDLASKLKVPVPEFESFMKKTNGTRVHYNKHAIKTKLSLQDLQKILY